MTLRVAVLIVLASWQLAYSSFARSDPDLLLIRLSDASLRINEARIDVRHIDEDLTRFEHKIYQVSEHSSTAVHLFALTKYPIRFIRYEQQPFASFHITFDRRVNNFRATTFITRDIRVDDGMTVSAMERLLRAQSIEYSKRTIAPDMTVLDSSMTDFVIVQAIFMNSRIYMLEVSLNRDYLRRGPRR